MDVCLVSHNGALLLHRPRQAAPAPVLKALPPSREGRVVAGACRGPWEGRAALCAAHALPLVLGPALSRPALQGGKAQHATREAPKMAALLRGGMLPQAAGSPAARRSPRARWRRRTPLRRQRAARWAPVPHTPSPYPVPDLGKNLASKATREGELRACTPRPSPRLSRSPWHA